MVCVFVREIRVMVLIVALVKMAVVVVVVEWVLVMTNMLWLLWHCVRPGWVCPNWQPDVLRSIGQNDIDVWQSGLGPLKQWRRALL